MIAKSLKQTGPGLKNKQTEVKYLCQFQQGFVVFYFLVSSADSTGGTLLHNNDTYLDSSTGKSSLPLVAKIVGSLLLALLCLSGGLWFAFKYRRKSR